MTGPAGAALDYAARGWPVLPLWWPEKGRCACEKPDCQHPGKHPLGKLAPAGRNSATTAPETIRRWWGRCPQASIGIVTGLESGLLVMDVDPRNGGHPNRLPGNLPITASVTTGGGGWHFYLAHPGNGFRFPKALPGCEGVDLKAAGGYVLAPPSLHISGQRYAWQIPHHSTPLAPCPEWLLELAKCPEHRPPSTIPAVDTGGLGSAYGRAALRGELTRLAQTIEGGRNNALNRAAYCLGRLVAAGHLDEECVVNLLLPVGANIGLGEREVRATVQSGLRAGLEGGHV
ncbi:MAG: DNA primase [Deltaproteobacteria bacterium]|nr:DNA primase [Deltaproteobacteria bacterium]